MKMTPAGTSSRYEDTLQCYFFSATEISKEEWEYLCESINGIIASMSNDYIWHRDEFRVYLPLTEATKEAPCHLMSTICFGDNIEDEWFIVHLLLEITKVYNHLIIQVEDNDGDFLLIEGADYLPAWANPETTENRVFIFNQHFHLIPETVAPTDTCLKLVDAIKLITQNPEATKVSCEIEQAIIKRIGDYPQKIKDSCHKAILRLPVEIATLLTLKPSLISSFVSTYCNLDALDAKHCKDVKFENCIDTEVKFTKFLYAMLIQSQLSSKFINSRKEKKIELGVKVTCAYQVIMSRISKDVYCTPEYKQFLNSLTKNGYFKDNLEHSLEYSELLEKAKAYFLNMESPISFNICNTIKEIKLSEEFESTVELLKQKFETEILKEDDEDWLNVNPDQLNEYLNNHYGKNFKLNNKDPITPHILTSDLKDFLKETSNLEGIENTKDSIDFNSEDFVTCLEKMLNMVSNQSNTTSDYSSDEDDENFVENDIKEPKCQAQDLELASKLKTIERDEGEISVLKNLSQSMKEEGITGPASIMLRHIGYQKSDLLDSDDDD